jgi:endonuclease YncB( thermonuclease family)
LIRAALLAFIAVPFWSASAEQAVVRQVIDGDALYACGSGCETVRFANIDTAEFAQLCTNYIFTEFQFYPAG